MSVLEAGRVASSYAVPVEAVKHGADFAGQITIGHLVEDGVALHEAAVVELGPHGWTATVLYTSPGRPTRQQVAHIALLWPREFLTQQGSDHGV